jgi:Zn-dependent protease
VFLLSLTCHEAAHAFAARLGGDDTAYLGGQASLNPLPHIRRDLLGTVLVPLLTYVQTGWMMGWASAPYDPHWEQRHPRRAAAMALAGPSANLLLAVTGFVALKIGLMSGTWGLPADPTVDRLVAPVVEHAGLSEGAARLFSILLVLNLVLLVFNLLPLPPMDGSAVLAGWVTRLGRLRDQLRSTPWASLAGLALAWLIFPYVFRPVLGWVLSRLYA